MQDETTLTLDRLFNGDEFKVTPFGPARWLPDDDGYTTLEAAALSTETAVSDTKVKEIVRYDIRTGTRTVLVTADQLRPAADEQPLLIEDYHWSPDKTRLLIFTHSQRVWRQNTRGDYWVLDLQNGQLMQLGGNAPSAMLMFAKFAPDSRAVAYVREHNIYVEVLDTGAITQLTTDGDDIHINGTADWVYEEEFRLRDGFCWSPDSQYIAYWQFDTSDVNTFYMINNTDTLYPRLLPLPYPKVGTTNAACRVGVVSVAGGATTWFAVPGDARQHYIPKMEWAASSEQVIIQQLNRLQNQNRVMLADIATGTVHTILTETDEAWVDVHNDLKWLDDGAAFTWVSDRDGWRHLYRVSRDGQEMTLLTPGAYDVISVQQVVAQTGWAYFIASPQNPTQRYLYRTRLDGSGDVEQLTPVTVPGTHSYDLSPTGEWAFHTYSTMDTPPLVSLIALPQHQSLRVLQANLALHERVAALRRQPTEFFRVHIADVALDGWCIKPPDFDPTRQYPVLFYVYGEPAGQTVLDRWEEKRYLWHVLLAQQGYVVISVDNRGTPAPRGRAWRKCVYRQVGVLTTADQAVAVQTILAERPYLDPARVGVWGWSGGGSMTLSLLFKHPDIYQVGIAIAAVSDQRLYDTIYQERYMGLPDDNAVGFRDGSPITFAHQLQGKLLLIHGTGDDNVHYQAFEKVVNALIRHNKPFAMMAYPNRSHAIKEGENTTRHLYSLMTRYLQENL